MSKSRIELDADIAALTMPEALAALKAYGPATRIENPRVRKAIREARMMLDRGWGRIELLHALQGARYYAARAARRVDVAANLSAHNDAVTARGRHGSADCPWCS